MWITAPYAPVIFILLLSGTVSLVVGSFLVWGDAQTLNQDTTTGTIQYSDVVVKSGGRSNDYYAPTAHYEYFVSGQRFEGSDTISEDGYNRPVKGTAEFANFVALRNPAGKTLTVYYDPAAPSKSTLYKGKIHEASLVLFGLGVLLIVLCLVTAFFVFQPYMGNGKKREIIDFARLSGEK